MITKKQYPATERQMSEWDYFLETNCRSRNLTFRTVLDEPDQNALQKTFNQLLKRHESLRTTFSFTGNELKQIISYSPQYILDIQYLDFSARENPDNEIALWSKAFEATIFNLEKGPLFLVNFIKINAIRHIIGITIDHLISDEMSLEILKDEFTFYYELFEKDEFKELRPLNFQMKEYALKERQVNNNDIGQRNLNYWKEILSADIKKFSLQNVLVGDGESEEPFDKSGGVYNIFMNNNTLKKIQAVSQNKYIYIVSSLLLWLSKLSGQKNFIVAIPYSGRESEELDSVVGYLILAMYLKIDIGEINNIEQLIPLVIAKYSEAIEYRHYSRRSLDVNIDRHCAMFINNITIIKKPFDYDTSMPRHYYTNSLSIYPLVFNINSFKNGWLLTCQYKRTFLTAKNIDSIFEPLVKLVTQL